MPRAGLAGSGINDLPNAILKLGAFQVLGNIIQAAQEARGEMAGRIYGPFPHEKRAEIYRFLIEELRRLSPATPYSICLESPEMWQELGPLMGQSPEAYACCCGGFCTPGQPLMSPP